MSFSTAKLGDVVDILSGFAFKSELFNDSEGMPLIRIRDVVRGYSDTRYLGEYSEQFVVQNGEMVIGMDGNFNVARWNGGSALLNQRVCKIAARKNVLDDGFLFHFLPSVLKKIEDATPFVTVKHLSATDLRAENIPLPPLPEQVRIAAILDHADALRVKRKEALVQLDNLAQSIFIEMFGDPATNPKKWKSGTVKDALKSGWLVEIQDGNHGERHPKASDFLTKGIPFIMANCLVDGQLDTNKAYKLDPSWLKRLRVGFAKPNDLLLSHKGTVGEVAIVSNAYADVILSPQTTYYRTSDKLNVKFLAEYFQTRWFQSILENEAKQSTRAYIGITRQQLLPMIFPPLNLQNEFARRLDCIGSLRKKFHVGVAELDALFASLQHRAFRGEL